MKAKCTITLVTRKKLLTGNLTRIELLIGNLSLGVPRLILKVIIMNENFCISYGVLDLEFIRLK